ncbi:hypothetical protein [Alteromonas sp. 14N.309.X.WAT.G.H12]|uniref:hypothetical protein n=1 Tax=Alteromonas sp. 14N.309.X.WAT.G.H12 TaxID=3120824 RepID=UPI002FD01934
MDTVLLFSSRYGFWSSENGWVKDISDAEFILSECPVVVRFKNATDIKTVRLSDCRSFLPLDFIDMADKVMARPECKNIKDSIANGIAKQSRHLNTELDFHSKFQVYAELFPRLIDSYAIVGKNSIVTLLNKAHCKPANKAGLVGPFIERYRKRDANTKRREKSFS